MKNQYLKNIVVKYFIFQIPKLQYVPEIYDSVESKNWIYKNLKLSKNFSINGLNTFEKSYLIKSLQNNVAYIELAYTFQQNVLYMKSIYFPYPIYQEYFLPCL